MVVPLTSHAVLEEKDSKMFKVGPDSGYNPIIKVWLFTM